MKKFIPIYIILLLCVFLCGAGLAINIPGIRSIFKGETVYTSSAVKKAREDGYNEGLKDKEMLETQIDSLKKERDNYIALYTKCLNDYNSLLQEFNLTKEQLKSSNAENELLKEKITTLTTSIEQMQAELDYYIGKLEEFSQTKYCKVTFQANDSTFALVYVLPNEYAQLERIPTKPYCQFKGWSINEQDVIELDSYQITQDTTFIAVFESISGIFNSEGELTKSWQDLLSQGYFSLTEANTISNEHGNYLKDCEKNKYFLTTSNVEVAKTQGLPDGGFNAIMQGNLVIDESVVAIDEYSFAYCDGLESIEMPSVIDIARCAFRNCEGLNLVSLSKNAKVIFPRAFENTYPKNIYFDGTVDDWVQIARTKGAGDVPIDLRDTSLYIDKTLLTNAVISSSDIQDYAFINYKKLTEVTLNNTVTNVGYGAFDGCGNLNVLNSSDNLEIIEPLAFNNTKIEFVELGANVHMIGESAFNSNVRDKQFRFDYKGTIDSWCEINFGDGSTITEVAGDLSINKQIIKSINLTSTTKINNLAFKGCKSLNSINLGNVTEIGNDVFSGCSSLNEIIWSEQLMSIGDRAFYMTGLTNVNLPNSLETIGTLGFGFCKITNVVLGTNLKRIGESAFRGNSVETVTFNTNAAGWTARYWDKSALPGNPIKTHNFTMEDLSNPQTNAHYLTEQYTYEWTVQ